MSNETRPYRKRKRAEAEEETRRRITASAVELHGTLGPARTTMSAVAEHAGVRRSTLYRHFPDETALLGACSAHWSQEHPVPDLAAWAAVADPDERLRTGLAELYGFFARNERMLSNLVRDEELVAAVAEHFGEFRGYLEAAADVLLRGRGLRGRARREARAALGLAVQFTTWRDLVGRQGLDDRSAVELMARLVACRDRP